MPDDSRDLKVGQLVHHPEFGEGVIASSPVNGLVSVLFKKGGEKQVEVSALASAQDRLDDTVRLSALAAQVSMSPCPSSTGNRKRKTRRLLK